MRASFTDEGHLILHPETTLERMAAKAFVQSMRTRNKPEVRISEPAVGIAQDGRALYSKSPADVGPCRAPQGVSLIAQESDDIPGQAKIDDVIKAVGGV